VAYRNFRPKGAVSPGRADGWITRGVWQFDHEDEAAFVVLGLGSRSGVDWTGHAWRSPGRGAGKVNRKSRRFESRRKNE